MNQSSLCLSIFANDSGKTMFIEISKGWHINLAQVAKIQIVDLEASGTLIKLYSPANEMLGEFTPATADETQRIIGLIHEYGK